MEMKPYVKMHPIVFGIIVAALAILLSVIVMQQAGLRISSGAPAMRAAATAQASSHKQLYISVMHPWIVQDHPGTCPICGMELVKMDSEQQAEYLRTHPNV